MILTSTEGQSDLPRYFAQVFAMMQGMRGGRLDFVLPDGRRFRAEGAAPGRHAEIAIHDPDCFARLIREGDLGFSEAYMDGDWSTPDLMTLLDLAHDEVETLFYGFPGQGWLRRLERMRHWLRSNSRGQARRNIRHHYDLGNDFYALWLDPSMTYSSALFEGSQQSLEAAQRHKYERLVDRLGVVPGDHVLEIGCGWGGFAEYAAGERGLKVTGLTLSAAQLDYARDRIARAGLSDRVELRLEDYRDVRGSYDGIASIEMFEAVGERYWPVYFDGLRDRLHPGRRAALQVITLPDHRFAQYRQGVDFIQKYIFPGGMLPSPGILRRLAEEAGLRMESAASFGESYSRTLRIWHENFNARWEEARALGFDARFRRMWNFYLCACASTFRSGNCDVSQFTLSRPG
ncbi:cyclopropane-fatty-acyl-phospholipid synthase family protein [Limimaricola variabilis]|uniref:cyclopropane-fatty-acyl-phospholipid synthase family protein n=1 Tax=Limimaricola variabilis TaxID=1492771 RepID=UPI002AC9B861|nr:cyclopropane-fatty-acyl-phospholipid synthase family protein [Limimaricola variabilis]WPY94827.1 cyclopropane-fatty-acyl-phospholipid synthase family protein [Limimaricola variabilis]